MNRRQASATSVLAALAFAAPAVSAVSAQQNAPASDTGRASRTARADGVPVLHAAPVGENEPTVDGVIEAEEWAAAPVASDFVQFQPDEGAPASQRTEARVLYGRDALYVAMRAWDTAPDSIAAQLSRRDQQLYSDWVAVMVDSYRDRRTAFHFMVNPKGVKIDVFRYDDVEEDDGWDAVWDVATSTDAEGWSAEFRIPYSQLRFRDAEEQVWGINFIRELARHDEISAWAPTLRSESAIVSRFGELRGLVGVEPARRLEITPYTLARVRRRPGDPENPFHESTETFGTLGADMKYGVTGDLTLDVTINPDFGQVEADPAQVNLSAFETFFSERRPFFVEGSNLFDFSLGGGGDGGGESLFYSRRIGRTPQGRPGGDWVDRPENTTILGAMKLSGKTAGGWSIGTLAAVTSEERADVAWATEGAGGPEIGEATVEPMTMYGLARIGRDFRQGRSAVGVIATALGRDRVVANALGLHRTAMTGGVDFRHRFGGDEYSLNGYLMGSSVAGSPEAITATQTSSARWFQRPDADHVEVDPTRTGLSGMAASASISKFAGGHWRWSAAFQTRSPEFEANDAGYMRESDYHSVSGYAGYDQSSPQGPFRRWRLNLNTWSAFSWGGERYNSGGNVNGNFQLANFWNGYAGINYNHGGLSNGLLRGGPAMIREPNLNGWLGLGTDGRRAVRGEINGHWSVRRESDSWSWGLDPHVTWRPSGRASISLGPSLGRSVDDLQWVRAIGTADGDRYLFARIDQTTVGLTGRVDYAFSPTLSLQLYAQPFVAAGEYGDFKQVSDPRADAYADRVVAVPAALEDGEFRGDLDGDGEDETWGDPSFNFKQFRSNAVLRWEYRPGSSLYVVWSQGRDHFASSGAFDLDGDMGDLFGARPDNIFMVKLSWWMNP